MSPGFKTSEFIVTLIPALLGVVLVLFGAYKGQKDLMDTGLWLLLGGSGSYSLSRGLAKLGTGSATPAPAESAPATDTAAASVVAGIGPKP